MLRIGITQRIEIHSKTNEIRSMLDISWIKVSKKLNFILIPILPFFSKEYINTLALAGVIFSGGNDLSSVNNEMASLMRDKFEDWLLHICIENNIPVLGICRGAQFIAEIFGGKISIINNHVAVRHSLTVTEEGRRRGIPLECEVNSYHKFAIKELPKNITILAHTKDKSIEAYTIFNVVLGLMWHPERENQLKNMDVKLISQLFRRE